MCGTYRTYHPSCYRTYCRQNNLVSISMLTYFTFHHHQCAATITTTAADRCCCCCCCSPRCCCWLGKLKVVLESVLDVDTRAHPCMPLSMFDTRVFAVVVVVVSWPRVDATVAVADDAVTVGVMVASVVPVLLFIFFLLPLPLPPCSPSSGSEQFRLCLTLTQVAIIVIVVRLDGQRRAAVLDRLATLLRCQWSPRSIVCSLIRSDTVIFYCTCSITFKHNIYQ